jgi:hypothetical protein
MSLSDLALLGSFVSGMAVVVSFVFLALQIRQSNANQRSLMRQARTAQFIEIYMKLSEPYLSDLMVRSEKSDAEMTPVEIQSYFRIWGAWFRQFENNYHQFKAGMLDAASWDVDVANLRYLLSSPGVRTAWRTERLIMGGGAYRQFVDDLMASTPSTAEHYDYAKIWKKRFDEEELRARGGTMTPHPSTSSG